MSFYTIGSQHYFIGNIGNIVTTFEINAYNQLNRVTFVDKTKLTSVTPSASLKNEILRSMNIILDKYAQASTAIWKHLGGTPTEEKSTLQYNFTKWLLENSYHEKKVLDLSGIGLTTLPPQIGLFTKLETLNLSKNSLYLLPAELQRFQALKILDISENFPLHMNIPFWLGNMDCQIIAYNMNVNFLPKGLRENQVLCEVDFSSDAYHMQFTQVPIFSDDEGSPST